MGQVGASARGEHGRQHGVRTVGTCPRGEEALRRRQHRGPGAQGWLLPRRLFRHPLPAPMPHPTLNWRCPAPPPPPRGRCHAGGCVTLLPAPVPTQTSYPAHVAQRRRTDLHGVEAHEAAHAAVVDDADVDAEKGNHRGEWEGVEGGDGGKDGLDERLEHRVPAHATASGAIAAVSECVPVPPHPTCPLAAPRCVHASLAVRCATAGVSSSCSQAGACAAPREDIRTQAPLRPPRERAAAAAAHM